jgi:small subunit ribosomal protein S21
MESVKEKAGLAAKGNLFPSQPKTNPKQCKHRWRGTENVTRIREIQYAVDARWHVWRWIFLAEVRVQEGEPLENALRRFKRKVQQEDIIKEVKRHSYYLKPGEKRRVKAALARKRNRKKARKEQD